MNDHIYTNRRLGALKRSPGRILSLQCIPYMVFKSRQVACHFYTDPGSHTRITTTSDSGCWFRMSPCLSNQILFMDFLFGVPTSVVFHLLEPECCPKILRKNQIRGCQGYFFFSIQLFITRGAWADRSCT